jgi:hypothetical protein
MNLLVLQLVFALAVSTAALLYVYRDNRRLRSQNEEMQQLVADAAAQATLDNEHASEVLQSMSALRAENAALKGRQ